MDIIGIIKVKLLHKKYTSHYLVSIESTSIEVTEKIKGWEKADQIYQAAGRALRKNPFTKLKDIS